MKTKYALTALACAGAVATAAPASAEILLYKATDISWGNHGLWTNGSNGWAQPRFSFQDDVLLTIDTDTGTGTMTGTAINSLGQVAVLDLALGGFLETTLGSNFEYKQEGGAAYNEVTDINDVDFFTELSGSITIDGTQYDMSLPPFPNAQSGKSYAFQYGLGANAKRVNDFGGSSWLLVENQAYHWDLNFNLTAVPEPGTWLLMILGFGAIGASMRSSRRKVKTRIAYS